MLHLIALLLTVPNGEGTRRQRTEVLLQTGWPQTLSQKSLSLKFEKNIIRESDETTVWIIVRVREITSSINCVAQMLSRVRLFVTPWTVAHQAPLSKWFSQQEYWSGLPFPLPRNLPTPGIKPTSPALASGFFTTSTTWELTHYRGSMCGTVES